MEVSFTEVLLLLLIFMIMIMIISIGVLCLLWNELSKGMLVRKYCFTR